MAKPKINQKSKYKALNARLARYVLLVEKMFETHNLEATKLALSTGFDGSKPFSFRDYPNTKARLQDLLQSWRDDLHAIINTGTSREWANANQVQDLLADKVLSYYYGQEHGRKKRKYYQTNSDALQAFQKRKDNGMNLSDKIWNQSQNYREELEAALSSGIQKGMSAVTLSKRVSKYLNDFDKLKSDYKQRYGKEVDCLNCEYRSMRLARSEINMSYRTAEQERWQQFDFVVGYEIKLSKSHHDRMPHGDICDDLAGKYPKDFKWTGWHPNDMCYCIPILKTEEEFFADSDKPCASEVEDVPHSTKEWIIENRDRIEDASKNGTLPYWLKDNITRLDNDKIIQENAISLKGLVESFIGSSPSAESLSIDDTISILNKIVSDNSGWIKGEFDGFYSSYTKVKDAPDAFMASYSSITKDRELHQKIKIVNRDFVVKDADGNKIRFNPMNSLREALYSIANGKELTFNQEYAIESVWHEIMHCGAVGWKEGVKIVDNQRVSMEIINQFCARRSYNILLNNLGAKPANYDKILAKGFGYRVELANVNKILSHYGIPEDRLYDYFAGKIKSKNYNEIYDIFVNYLSRNGVKEAWSLINNISDPVTIDWMLNSSPK